ncbi:MAG: carboxypeptidase-like regulatory domain-containing protein, partial [Acidobacteriota bacterium]
MHKKDSFSIITLGFLFWAAFVLAGCAEPQRGTGFGSGSVGSESVILGSVRDDTDAPVHGAVVGVRNQEMGVTTFVVTNPEGEFQTPPLRNGS